MNRFAHLVRIVGLLSLTWGLVACGDDDTRTEDTGSDTAVDASDDAEDTEADVTLDVPIDTGGTDTEPDAVDTGPEDTGSPDADTGVEDSGMDAPDTDRPDVADSCFDSIRNGSESDVDCGGACPGCPTGGNCRLNGDCASGVCIAGMCQAPSCFDGLMNGEETGRDCGGDECDACPIGEGCDDGEDCMTMSCADGLCAPPGCTDGVMNGDETGIDCGGACPAGCLGGAGCVEASDCMSLMCVMETCITELCVNEMMDGDETDVDCGGTCVGCEDGLTCILDTDCLSRRCESGTCTSCEDGVMNGDEIGVDCGGSCDGCAVGHPCTADGDCISNDCDMGTCGAGLRSCRALKLDDPTLTSGTYVIQPDVAGEPVMVYCDMTTDGGGWTLVGSTNVTTFNDQSSDYYDDLATLNPTMGHEGIWNGLRDVFTSPISDIRFACKRTAADTEFGVDLSFYERGWYHEITTGTDGDSCFNESNGTGYDRPSAERRNNLTGMVLPSGTPRMHSAGDWMEGEDSCTDSGDFTVDFNNRGMDGSDPTDWGEDDSQKLCGTGSSATAGQWFIFVRESVCSNMMLDPGETDVDCGGTCRGCDDGGMCTLDADCASERCEGGACTSCEDSMMNGDETDVDCGGSCEPCDDRDRCRVDADCSSMSCEARRCRSCMDGRLNGDEVNIDCGGSCPGCLGGEMCTMDEDCASGNCDGAVCGRGYRSCKELLDDDPSLTDGIYTIQPVLTDDGVDVYCDMTTNGGGWTLVASSRNITLNDQGGDYYADLTTLSPAAGHTDVWNGMRPVLPASGNVDTRFTCRATPGTGPFTVDLTFFDTDMYQRISTGSDGESCFGTFDDRLDPPPRRRDNVAGTTIPRGTAWSDGPFTGEDNCGSTEDFTVDYNDRGMDGDSSDGTDWGEVNGDLTCGTTGLAAGEWFIWFRE